MQQESFQESSDYTQKYPKIANTPEYRQLLDSIETADLDKIIAFYNFAMMICAKRRTGKTVFMKDLLSRIYHRYKMCYLFSNTVELQFEVYDFIDEKYKFKGFQEDKLQEIYDKQEMYIKSQLPLKPKSMSESDYKKSLDHILLIFDDFIGDSKVRHSKTFNDLFILGRHLNIAVICLSQYYSSLGGISACARKNLDYCVSFFLDSESDQEHLVQDFMSKNGKKLGMQLYSDIATEEYQSVVICNNKTTRKYEEYVYKYIANPDTKKFKFRNAEDLKQSYSTLGDGPSYFYKIAIDKMNEEKQKKEKESKSQLTRKKRF